jgi:NitT/TauT family transport system substrate-binding protein
VSVQSRFLQYAAAKQWGDKEFNRLDKYTVAVPHPDATAALIAGGTELTGHFSNPPFQDRRWPTERARGAQHLRPARPELADGAVRHREIPQRQPENLQGLRRGAGRSRAVRPERQGAAADTYIRVTKAKIDRAELLKIIDNPQFEFSVTPKNTYPLAEFLYRVGAIKNKPESWKDYFFQDAKPLQGS